VGGFVRVITAYIGYYSLCDPSGAVGHLPSLLLMSKLILMLSLHGDMNSTQIFD